MGWTLAVKRQFRHARLRFLFGRVSLGMRFKRKPRKRLRARNPTVAARRRKAYLSYLRSPEWRAVRLLALERDGYRCRRCEEPLTALTAHVHHTTYAHFRHERSNLEDLKTLCRPCHRRHHSTADAYKKGRHSG